MLPAITWLPSPFKNLRDPRYAIRGVVNHRIVGTLPSARAAFGVAPGTSRNASSHFGIGFVGGRLTVDQYVDLADSAWTNGDVREPTWSRIIPGVNPNLYTVTIEHEDGGAPNRGRVSEEVWQASMALQKLLVSGDKDAIRAAGIRVRHDHIVAQLAAVPRDATGFIDHHQIAGPNKPYCFRRWLDDPGFVEGSPSRRDRLLALLNGEDDVLNDYLKTLRETPNRRARIRAGATARTIPAFNPKDYNANRAFVLGKDSAATLYGYVTGTNITLSNGQVHDPRTDWFVTRNDSHGLTFWHVADLIGEEPIEQGGGIPPDAYAALQEQAVTALRNLGLRATADADALAVKKP
jgi:hypothetical protein